MLLHIASYPRLGLHPVLGLLIDPEEDEVIAAFQ
jgi:hypothetical protein